MQRSFIIIKPAYVRCFVIIAAVVILYLIENPIVVAMVGGDIFNYIIKPAAWLGLAYSTWSLPKGKPICKIKLMTTIRLWAFNFAFIFIVASVAVALFEGLGKSPYNHSIKGVLLNIIAIGPVLLAKEIIRAYVVNSLTKKENYLLFLFLAFIIALTSIPLNEFIKLKDYKAILIFSAENFIPEFFHGLLCTYMAYLAGPLPGIIYMGIIKGFHWLSPVLPNFRWIINALIGTLCPLFFYMMIQEIYLREAKLLKRRDIKEDSLLSWLVTCVLSISIIWFSVGVFPIYPSVIATGSMEPMIKPGDVILVRKIKGEDVKVGDVIQFRRDSILISHRVLEIIKDEEKGQRYLTKGDNNSTADANLVIPEHVKGKIVFVVPKIGWPTLLIKSNNRDNIPMEEIVF